MHIDETTNIRKKKQVELFKQNEIEEKTLAHMLST